MDQVASVLALRARLVQPPSGGPPREQFAREVETELARLGWVTSPALRQAISRVPQPQAVAWADWLLATLQGDLGVDRAWVPLYRRFPHSTPANTDALFVNRMLASLFQEGEAPCVLCGAAGTVHAVSPCAHLVCTACFRPEEHSACPICLRRLDPTDPYLIVPKPPTTPGQGGEPVRLRGLGLATDPYAAAVALRDGLVSRLSPLAEDERRDLEVLVRATTAPGDLGWTPPTLPARETRAIVTALALRDVPVEQRAATIAAVAARWDTATDIARTLWALSGGSPSLHVPRAVERSTLPSEVWRPADEPVVKAQRPRVVALPRPLRTAVLGRLDTLAMPTVIEDVLRHPTVWKRIAERVHPFEQAARHPRASVVFSVLRESLHARESAPGRAVVAAADAGWVRLVEAPDGKIGARAITFHSRVEQAFDDGDIAGALTILGDRPGELLRALDRVARSWEGDPTPLVDAARSAARQASPRVAFGAMASLEGRDERVARAERATVTADAGRVEQERHAETARRALEQALSMRRRIDWSGTPYEEIAEASRGGEPEELLPAERAPRVYFPRGGAAFVWSAPDERPLLATGLPERLRAALAAGLDERAARLSRFDVAVVDAALRDMPVPSGSQTTSGSSWALPRGARVTHPPTDTLRLFLHWVEPDLTGRVDLDLSAVFFDGGWRRLGHCDWTRLDSDLGAVHSGDLTSAPPPLGATEFLDLDLARLRSAGVAWVVPVVFSYNDVPFERLTEAISGVMRPFPGVHFDPAGVLVRYDLTGDSRVSVPFVADVVDGRLRWLDQHLPSGGYAHSVGSRGNVLGRLVADLEALYAGSTRPHSLALALTHARARADRVVLRDGDRFTDLDGAPVEAPVFTGSRVLAVCVGDPPDLTGAHESSVVVSALGTTRAAAHPLSDLVDELDAVELA